MARDVSWVLYDTWGPSTVASVQASLFQIPQGGDSTHNPAYTNMRGAGSLPQSEKMKVNKVGIIPDQKVAVADLFKWFTGGLLELQVANVSVLQIPLSLAVQRAMWGGNLVMGTAADNGAIGIEGNGFELGIPVDLDGAIPFKVLVTQGSALSAQTFFKVALQGVYSLAGLPS